MCVVRKGTLDDAGAIAGIFNYYVATSTVIFTNHAVPEDGMRARLMSVVGHYPFYVAEDVAGCVIGYCYAHRWMPDEVYGQTWEITIYLAHDVRGNGIGARLLDRVINDCREQEAHVLISFITQGNERCEKLHRRAGFQLSGVMKEVGYKFGKYLNDAVYTLKL